jgi:hypothetical protein
MKTGSHVRRHGSWFSSLVVFVVAAVDVADVSVELRKLEDVLLNVGNLNDDSLLSVIQI